jgi:hypothetical protein
MDISFLLYWTRNFDLALLEQCEKVLQVQCSKFSEEHNCVEPFTSHSKLHKFGGEKTNFLSTF